MNEKRKYIEYDMIAEINGIKFHKESDMLKWYKENIGLGVIEDEMIMEEYQINNKLDTHVLGGCYNSIPYFLRMQERQEGYESWFEGSLNKHASVLVEGNYEELCPKVAWGVTAYLAGYAEIDKELGLCFLIEGTEVGKERLFLEYLNLCKSVYLAKNKRKYDHYKASKDELSLARLDRSFHEQHLADERGYIERSTVDDLLLGGRLKSVAEEYLSFVIRLKDGTPGEPSNIKREYSDDLVQLFKGHTELINELIGKSDKEISSLIKRWSKEKDKFGKPLIENPDNNLKTSFATALKNAGMIKKSIDRFSRIL